MGNNDSLPPPPPPGVPGQPLQPPHSPNAPLPPPAPYAPTQAVPMTQQMPAAFAPAVPPQKSKLPVAIVALVVVAGLGVGAYFAFGKKDDKKGITAANPSVTTRAAPDTTTVDTFVITSPVSPATTAPTPTTLTPTTVAAGPADITVTDDTKFFSVSLPGTFKTDTTPIDANGTQVAQVSGSEDLATYANGHDTPGVTVVGGPADKLQAPADLVNIFDPGASVCATRNQVSGVTTSLGAAEVLYIDGCGANKASKVIMAVQVSGAAANVFVVVAQGPGPANGGLAQFAQAVLETITPL